MRKKKGQDLRRWLLEAVATPEERARHKAEMEEKTKRRAEKKWQRELSRLGLTQEEWDERLRAFKRKFYGVEK